MAFYIDEYVRWGDVDSAGVIFHGAYVRFFEIAETELFRTAGVPYGQVFDRFDCWLPRVRYLCEFRAQARLDEQLRVHAFVKRLGRTSITLGFRVERNGSVRVADCEIVLVCVGRQNFDPRPLPDELRAALSPFAE